MQEPGKSVSPSRFGLPIGWFRPEAETPQLPFGLPQTTDTGRLADVAVSAPWRSSPSRGLRNVCPIRGNMSPFRQSATAADSRQADRTAFATEGRTCQNKVNDGQQIAHGIGGP